MLHVISKRDGTLLNEYDGHVINVAWSFVKYELGYGGRIVESNDTKVVVDTDICSHVDRTIITGSKEEMLILITSVLVHVESRPDTDEIAETAIKITDGNALLLTHSSGMLMGGALFGQLRLRLCFLTAVGINDYDDLFCDISDDDFVDYLKFYYDSENKEEAIKMIQDLHDIAYS